MKISAQNKTYLKTISVLALPIALQNLLDSLVNMLDSFMVGTLGLSSINAVSFANQIFFLASILIFGICSGSGIFMGQFWGNKDKAGVHKVMGICLVTSIIGASLFAAAAWIMPETLIGLYTKNPEIIALGADYIRLAAVTYILCAFIYTINFSLRSIGQTRIPMLTTIVSLICNTSLNYLFIIVLDYGVMGAALGTVIARFVELGAQLIVMRAFKLPIFAPVKDYFRASKAFIKEYFKTTTSVIINEFVWALGTSIYNMAYQFAGNEAQGAVAIMLTVSNLFFVLGIGLGAGSGVMIANRLGAGQIPDAIDCAKRTMKLGALIALVMGIMLVLFSPLIVNIYNVSDQVKTLAQYNLYVFAGALLLKTFNFITIVGILRSGGDTTYCLVLDMVGVWVIGVPMAFLGTLVLGWPIYFVLILVNFEEVFKMIMSWRRVNGKKWARNLVSGN